MRAVIIALLILISSFIAVFSQPAFTEEQIVLGVYLNGTVSVVHYIQVSEDQVFIDVKALTKPLEPVIAAGQSLYDTEVIEVDGTYYIRVYAPDKGILTISYLTKDLVIEEGPSLYKLSFNSTSPVVVVLAEGLVPFKAPKSALLNITDGKYIVSFPQGTYELLYYCIVKPPVFVVKATITDVEYKEQVGSGENVEIKVHVLNSGNGTGTVFVKLFRDDVMLGSESITLEPNESKTILFKVSAPSTLFNVEKLNLRIECGHDGEVDDTRYITINVNPAIGYEMLILVVAVILVAIVSALFIIMRKTSRKPSILSVPLTELDYVIVDMLKKGDYVQSSLVKILRERGVPTSTIYRHLDKLEKYGIIRRDRRDGLVIVSLVQEIEF